jgi:ferredoxin hydrogenase large subunit
MVIKSSQKNNRMKKSEKQKQLLFIEETRCEGCSLCKGVCPVDAIRGSFLKVYSIDRNKCILCGQCCIVCPFDAVTEADDSFEKVAQALDDPKTKTVAITSPSLGKDDKNIRQEIEESLLGAGFDRVMTAEGGASLYVTDDGTELVKRMTRPISGPLPLITSSCPAWVRYAEQFHPEIIPHLPHTKPPVVMLGSMIKKYSAKNELKKGEHVFTAAVMPCIAKKDEITRPRHRTNLGQDIDAVITARHLKEFVARRGKKKTTGTQVHSMRRGAHEYRSLPKSGGVLEQILRYVHRNLTRKNIASIPFTKSPIGRNIKEGHIGAGKFDIRYAAVEGTSCMSDLIDDIIKRKSPYHIIEVLACPGGCEKGGGREIHGYSIRKMFVRLLFIPIGLFRKIFR